MNTTESEPDMIPRIVVRDMQDLDTLLMSLQLYMEIRIRENTTAARLPGANQYGLSLELIEETRYICGLIEAMGDSMDAKLEETDGPDETNGK
jgi:hypothetical protein